MRALWITPFPPQRDGIGDYSSALVTALREADHVVRILRPSELAGGTAVEHLTGVDVVHVQLAVAAFGRTILRLPTLLRAARATSTPVVVTVHEVTRDLARLRGVGRWLYRRVLTEADHVLAHTPQAAMTAHDVIGVPGRLVEQVPMPQRPAPEPTVDGATLSAVHGLSGSPVLLAFGFVHFEKGLDTTVAALARLRRMPGVPSRARLVVAGTVRRRRGALRAFEVRDHLHLRRVRRMIRRLGLTDAVTFTGYVPDGEIAAWFDVADAVILAYRRVEQSAVGALARAAGTPVVASDAGQIAAEFSEPRWTFPAGDPGALADALGTLLTSDSGGQAPQAADPAAQLESIVGRLVELYERLTGDRATHPTDDRSGIVSGTGR